MKLIFKLIFTTASDEFAIKAFKFSAIDYLLKPIDPDDLITAVEKVESQKAPTSRLDLLKENLNQPKKFRRRFLETLAPGSTL